MRYHFISRKRRKPVFINKLQSYCCFSKMKVVIEKKDIFNDTGTAIFFKFLCD